MQDTGKALLPGTGEQDLGEEVYPASARYRKALLLGTDEQELGEEDYPASAGHRKGTSARIRSSGGG